MQQEVCDVDLLIADNVASTRLYLSIMLLLAMMDEMRSLVVIGRKRSIDVSYFETGMSEDVIVDSRMPVLLPLHHTSCPSSFIK